MDGPAHEQTLTGRGVLDRGRGRIGTVFYTIHINPANGQAFIVELDSKPVARDGELVRLTLEDGRVLNCRILDESPYCAVVGDGPIIERRRRVREA